MHTHKTVIVIFYPVQIGSRSSGWQNWLNFFFNITIWCNTFCIIPKEIFIPDWAKHKFLQLQQCWHCRFSLFFYHYSSSFPSSIWCFFISLLSRCAQLQLPHLSQLPCCALCQPPLCLVGRLPASCQSVTPDMSHKIWAVSHFPHPRTSYPNFIIVVLILDEFWRQLDVRVFSHCCNCQHFLPQDSICSQSNTGSEALASILSLIFLKLIFTPSFCLCISSSTVQLRCILASKVSEGIQECW